MPIKNMAAALVFARRWTFSPFSIVCLRNLTAKLTSLAQRIRSRSLSDDVDDDDDDDKEKEMKVY